MRPRQFLEALEDPDAPRCAATGERAEILRTLLVHLFFADLARRRSAWQRALEGWNMERSRTALELERKGELKGRRGAILQVFQDRFRVEVPADLAARVEGLKDPDQLSRWPHAASTAPSLDAFRAVVGR